MTHFFSGGPPRVTRQSLRVDTLVRTGTRTRGFARRTDGGGRRGVVTRGPGPVVRGTRLPWERAARVERRRPTAPPGGLSWGTRSERSPRPIPTTPFRTSSPGRLFDRDADDVRKSGGFCSRPRRRIGSANRFSYFRSRFLLFYSFAEGFYYCLALWGLLSYWSLTCKFTDYWL